MEQPPDPPHNNDEPDVAAEEAAPAVNFEMVVRELREFIEDVHDHIRMIREDRRVVRRAAARVPRGLQFRLRRRFLRHIGAQFDGVRMGYLRLIPEAEEALADLMRDQLIEPAMTTKQVLQIQLEIAARRHLHMFHVLYDYLDYFD